MSRLRINMNITSEDAKVLAYAHNLLYCIEDIFSRIRRDYDKAGKPVPADCDELRQFIYSVCEDNNVDHLLR